MKRHKIHAIKKNSKSLDKQSSFPGDTELHRCIRGASNLNEFKANYQHIDPAKCDDMAITVNNQGQIPLDLLQEKAFSFNDAQEISNILIKRMLNVDILPHNQLIDCEAVLEKYKNGNNSALEKNLIIACSVANETRQLIKYTDTHPDCNANTVQANALIKHKVDKTRQGYLSQVIKNTFFSPIKSCLEPQALQFDIVTSMAAENMAGDCLEYSLLVKKKLQEHDKNLAVEVLKIENGDHVFVCIGENENKVICDAWAGKVFPFSEAKKELFCFEYRNENQKINSKQDVMRILKRYNPHYHKIIKDPSLDDMVFDNRVYIGCLGFFSASLALAYKCYIHPYLEQNKLA